MEFVNANKYERTVPKDSEIDEFIIGLMEADYLRDGIIMEEIIYWCRDCGFRESLVRESVRKLVKKGVVVRDGEYYKKLD